MKRSKPFWKSKTFLSALASALQPYLPYLAFASAVAAAAFRTTADRPLSARRSTRATGKREET